MSPSTSTSTDRPDYPRDEFDDLAAGDGRRGAHRARPHPALAVVPLLLVVVAVVALVVAAITLLSGEEPAGTAARPGPPPAAQPPAAPTSPEESAAEPEPSPETAPVPPDAVVDTTTGVTVLNGTTTAGLAGQAAQQLTDSGWTVSGTDNYRGDQQYPTTVFYPSEGQAATAQALADVLGGTPTQLSAEFESLTVVLGEDYRP